MKHVLHGVIKILNGHEIYSYLISRSIFQRQELYEFEKIYVVHSTEITRAMVHIKERIQKNTLSINVPHCLRQTPHLRSSRWSRSSPPPLSDVGSHQQTQRTCWGS